MANELHYQKVFIDAVNRREGHAFKASSRFIIGVVDVYVKLPGLMGTWVEVKLDDRPKKKEFITPAITALQKQFMKDEINAGGRALVLSFLKEGTKLWACVMDFKLLMNGPCEIRVDAHQLLPIGARDEALVRMFIDA
jgi:hypothetical protein